MQSKEVHASQRDSSTIPHASHKGYCEVCEEQEKGGNAHQECQGSDLKQDAKLGLGGGGCHVGEHALLLHDDLEHIGDHASGVAERVLLSDVVGDEALVVGVVEGRAQVAGAEHLALA